jgi:3-deoxy-D-manno-octulosonic-acid transferase
LRSAQRLGWLARPVFRALAAVWAQTPDDAQRLQQLGAPVQGVMGNFKFDAAPDAALLDKGRALRSMFGKPIVLFSSSREGEEAIWLQEFIRKVPETLAGRTQAAMKNVASGVQWLIVPRHPQRFDAVEQLLLEAGLRVSRRSTWGDGPPTEADVWLGDSLREMAMYYGMADAALLGGSFAPLGGQNLIEAAACGCPIFMGPHTFNFARAAALAEEAGAAFELPDMTQAMDAAYALVAEPERLLQARQAALDLSRTHGGAAKRTAAAVRSFLLT